MADRRRGDRARRHRRPIGEAPGPAGHGMVPGPGLRATRPRRSPRTCAAVRLPDDDLVALAHRPFAAPVLLGDLRPDW